VAGVGHRAMRPVLIAAIGLVGTACANSPLRPEPPVSVALRIAGDPVMTLSPRDTAALRLEREEQGRVVALDPIDYAWRSSNPALVDVGASGVVTAAAGFGQAVITARSTAGDEASVRIWVQPAEGSASDYRITLVFDESVRPEWRRELRAAAARWERVIRARLPGAEIDRNEVRRVCGPEVASGPVGGVERGTRIFVRARRFIQEPRTEAVGGPCLQRPLPDPTTIYGVILLNDGIPYDSLTTKRRQYLALHEMGHVLGLVGVILGRQPEWFRFDPLTGIGTYTGPMGLEGHRRKYGTTISSVTIRGGHWPFHGDVMGNVDLQISTLSVGALMDLGYPAAWYGAH